MLTDKAIVLCILQILKRYSDSEHILSVSDIIAKLHTDYALEISDRRTVYKAIDMLTDPYLGYEISKYNENGKGYNFVKDGMDFEPEQIQMISDAVCAFPFISLEATKEICDKLQGQLSVHEQNVIKRLSVIDSDRKTANKELFLNVDVLDKAISRKVKVQFDYYRYDIDKKLHKRREKKYTVNPYGLIYCNEHYYLACIICYGSEMGLYRVDLMKNVTLTEYKMDDPNREFSYKDELKKAVNGFLGEQIAIKMLVDKREI